MSIDLDGAWANISGEVNGKPAYIRLNEGLTSLVGTMKYGQELVISVKLKETDDRGMPSEIELVELNNFEDAIRPTLQEGLESVLAVVMTTDGFRDFIFYTTDPKSAFHRLQALQASFKNMQVDVRSRPDADWTQFKRFATP